MKRTFLRAASASIVALLVASCGARTGLDAPEPSQCVSLDATAPLADLDVFTMMDASGSMVFETANGTSKWEAVRQALAQFLQDPDSKGIGAAITFFPIIDEAIPATCDSDLTCGGLAQACMRYGLCWPNGSGTLCDFDQDCVDAGFPEDTCHPIGFCENDIDTACLPQDGVGCDPSQGACLDVGLCENHWACPSAAYETPAVPLGTLPEAAQPILNAIDATLPDGATTTLPALTGAISGAIQWTGNHPGHKAIVLLATDGFPTVCDPALHDDNLALAIDHIADAAKYGSEHGVQTFVIGVFGPDEAAEATPGLNQIAQGGGTDQAYFVSTGGDVTEQFLAALNDVRVTSKSCEFAIPLVEGQLPDLEKMTVSITGQDGQTTTVKRVKSAGACHPIDGGYYFDTPLGSTPPPGRVILCPASCALFGTSLDRQVKLQVSCD